MKTKTPLKVICVISVLLVFASLSWAAGKCPKCGKIWNQPFARDFTQCPEDGTKLVEIEKTSEKQEGETVRAISIKKVEKQFSNYYRRKVALCVGINNYPHFPTLEYAVKDAQTIAGVLKGHDFDEVVLLTDSRAGKNKIVNELLRIKAETNKDDLVVFYFAGHGATDKDHEGKDQGYLLAADTKDKNIRDTGISMGLFKDISETMSAKHILFLVDSCYSGYGLTRTVGTKSFEPGDDIRQYLQTITGARAVELLTAGGKDELAHERQGHGIFTSFLLDALEGKTTHADDGVITALEIASYIKQNVIRETRGKQSPAFGYLLGNGDVAFITGRQPKAAVQEQKPLTIAEIEALYKEALALEEKGDYQTAETRMNMAYVHYRRLPSPDEATLIKYLKLIGTLSREMQKNDMAIYYGNELLGTSKEILDHALAYNSIGGAYRAKGEYDRAIGYYQKSLKIYLDKLGPDHPDVAASYNNIGDSYDSKGEYDRAIENFQKSLKIRLDKLGPDHPYVAASYGNIGNVYDSKGEYDRSIEYYQKSLKIFLDKLGPDHPDVAASYNNIGNAYRAKGEYERAIGYYQKSLKIYLDKLGPDHPDVAGNYYNIGGAYRAKGEYDRSIEYFQKSLKIQLAKLGPDHPNVAASYGNIGIAYVQKGEYDRSIEYYQKSLKIKLDKLGPDHPDVAASYGNIGNAYYHKGEYDRAIEYHRKSLKIWLDKLGPDHPYVAASNFNLGLAYAQKGVNDRAIEYYQKSLKILLDKLGSEHPQTKAVQKVLDSLSSAPLPEQSQAGAAKTRVKKSGKKR